MTLFVLRDDAIEPERGGEALARVLELNPALDGGPEPFGAPAPGLSVCWSGSLSEDGPFARDPATWLPGGLAALGDACDRAAPGLEAAGARVLLRPHARHVLSDPARCRSFLADRSPAFGLCLEPAAMYEVSMLDGADDHLVRILEGAGRLAEIVIVSDAAPPGPEAPEEAPPARPALGAGALSPEAFAGLVRETVRPEAAVALAPGTPDAVATLFR